MGKISPLPGFDPRTVQPVGRDTIQTELSRAIHGVEAKVKQQIVGRTRKKILTLALKK
jgi:hypothetical protein